MMPLRAVLVLQSLLKIGSKRPLDTQQEWYRRNFQNVVSIGDADAAFT